MVKSEGPDIVILDIGPPDISGFQVLAEVRLFCEVPIIILSIWGDETGIANGLALRADDHMVKPFKQVELPARMEALTTRQSLGR